jgi:nucleoside phosphorylase
MINVLIVDDDSNKAAKIASVCDRVLDAYGVSVVRVINVSEAIRELKRLQFDLLVLDLNLPMRSGAPPKEDGGLQVFRQIAQRRPGIRVPAHVVGLSGFDELISAQAAQFASHGWVLVKYSVSGQAWEEMLANRLLHLATVDNDPGAFKTDLAIVTALHSVELEKILELPASWKEHRIDNDYSVYYRGRFDAANGRSVDVVAAASVEMGMAASCALATKIIYAFRPRFMCMAGIAASASRAAAFGDVLIATSAYDYGAGKSVVTRSRKGIFQPAPEPISIHQWLKARIEVFRMTAKAREFLTERWTGKVPVRQPTLRSGPVASGAAVVANRQIVQRLIKGNRKVIGVEMEVFGVFMAAKVAAAPAPQVFAMKSVCDFAGRAKDDRYQLYAAHTSAYCVYEFARLYLAHDAQQQSNVVDV